MSNLFANALTEMCNLTETANGAITNKSSLDSVLDLFSIIGNAVPENYNIKNLFRHIICLNNKNYFHIYSKIHSNIFSNKACF